MKKAMILVTMMAWAGNVSAGVGDSWNLGGNWDTINNPSGPWTYHQAAGTPFNMFTDWGGPDFPLGEMGWILLGKPGHLGMSKLAHNSSEDTSHTYSYAAGEFCGHTNEPWGAEWIVPVTEGMGGYYRLTGSLHKIRNGMGTVIGTLVAGGVQQFSYRLLDNGAGMNLANPYTFTHVVQLDAGAVVDLTISNGGENGDFGCIGNFNIEHISGVKKSLTVVVDPAQVNTVTPAAGVYQINVNEYQALSATTYANCVNNGEVRVFQSWTGGVVDPNAASTTVLMDTDKTVTAHFVDGRQCGDTCHAYPQYDFNQDCLVNVGDFAMFAATWLTCTQPACD